jgi:hypothetical protein
MPRDDPVFATCNPLVCLLEDGGRHAAGGVWMGIATDKVHLI